MHLEVVDWVSRGRRGRCIRQESFPPQREGRAKEPDSKWDNPQDDPRRPSAHDDTHSYHYTREFRGENRGDYARIWRASVLRHEGQVRIVLVLGRSRSNC